MTTTLFASLAAFVTLAAPAPVVAHASIPTPAVGHCADVGPVSVLSQQVIGTYEVCVPA